MRGGELSWLTLSDGQVWGQENRALTEREARELTTLLTYCDGVMSIV